jgi:hypothetical protein
MNRHDCAVVASRCLTLSFSVQVHRLDNGKQTGAVTMYGAGNGGKCRAKNPWQSFLPTGLLPTAYSGVIFAACRPFGPRFVS